MPLVSAPRSDPCHPTSASCGGEADGEAHERIDREHVGVPEQRQTGDREHCVEQVGAIANVGHRSGPYRPAAAPAQTAGLEGFLGFFWDEFRWDIMWHVLCPQRQGRTEDARMSHTWVSQAWARAVGAVSIKSHRTANPATVGLHSHSHSHSHRHSHSHSRSRSHSHSHSRSQSQWHRKGWSAPSNRKCRSCRIQQGGSVLRPFLLFLTDAQ